MAKLDSNQDSAWKEMLDEYLPSFLRFFFPPIAAGVDWSRGYESLDKELAEIRPTEFTGRLLADKLFKVWLVDGQPTWLLVHVEVQGRGGPTFTKRVFVYNYRLMNEHGAEVVSLAVLTGANPGRTGEYRIGRWGCTLDFRFPVARIADYAARWEELAASDNPFALAVMAQLKALETKGDYARRYGWKRRLIFSLYERGYDRERVVNLFRFMDWVMRLPDDLDSQLKQEVYEIKEGRRMPYLSNIERMAIREGQEKGMQQGLQRGLQQGLRQGLATAVTLQLTHRFGALSDAAQARLKNLSPAQTSELSVALLDFKTKADLTAWLKEHAPSVRSARLRK